MAIITVDFDGTLYEGNSFGAMFSSAKKEFKLKEWFIVSQGLAVSAAYRIIKGKQAFRHAFFKSFAKSFKGKNAQELESFFTNLVQQGVDEVNYDLVSRIQKHQKEGDKVIILSGALQPFLHSFVKELSLDVHIIGTELIVDRNGICTGEIGTIVNGNEKVRKVTDWLSSKGAKEAGSLENEEIWAYADSEQDLPLLKFVHYPVVVNPDTKMKEIAVTNEWSVFNDEESAS